MVSIQDAGTVNTHSSGSPLFTSSVFSSFYVDIITPIESPAEYRRQIEIKAALMSVFVTVVILLRPISTPKRN